MSFDFTKDQAVVNVPLSKRGDIDAQIDRYKAEQERAERAAYAAHRANKAPLIAEARRLFDAAPDSTFAAIAARHGMTPKQVRAVLKSYVRARPQWIIGLLAGEK